MFIVVKKYLADNSDILSKMVSDLIKKLREKADDRSTSFTIWNTAAWHSAHLVSTDLEKMTFDWVTSDLVYLQRSEHFAPFLN